MVFYHLRTVSVNHGHDVALQVVDVEVVRTIEAHHGRLVLRVIEEVQIIAALRHVDDAPAAWRDACLRQRRERSPHNPEKPGNHDC